MKKGENTEHDVFQRCSFRVPIFLEGRDANFSCLLLYVWMKNRSFKESFLTKKKKRTNCPIMTVLGIFTGGEIGNALVKESFNSKLPFEKGVPSGPSTFNRMCSGLSS